MDAAFGAPVECGYLTVPENRRNPNSRTIKIFVAVIKSDQPNPQPVVYLAGGPGGSATMQLGAWLQSEITVPYDFVMIDQRGTGFSEPNLNCPEMEGKGFPAPPEDVRACHDRLIKSGIDLDGYNSRESAADIADLRLALGYESWDVLGISYGTRLALTLMRDHPEGIRAVVLDSIYPPNVNSIESIGVLMLSAFQRLWDACAADEACGSTFPGLDQIFYKVVTDLNAEPQEVEGQSIETGKPLKFIVTGDDIIDRLYLGLGGEDIIPAIPGLLALFAMGNYDFLPLVMGINPLAGNNHIPGRSMLQPAQPSEGDTSDAEGARLSVECSEEFPFNSKEKGIALISDAPEAMKASLEKIIVREFSDCENWAVTPGDPLENEAVKSDIPVLMLVGHFDPLTPPEWAKKAAETLPNATYVEFPNLTHGISDYDPCPDSILAAFLANPTATLDMSCVAEMVVYFQTQ
ncbi:MAG TPA: alpha/beta hydrolase [Aggregatilineales bacterium]|nr:alpha/beta hydrolase [Anaerolineales bacterium]HRE48544.1 alpha/beta hydrolase [Aggregatilineales bacterium]